MADWLGKCVISRTGGATCAAIRGTYCPRRRVLSAWESYTTREHPIPAKSTTPREAGFRDTRGEPTITIVLRECLELLRTNRGNSSGALSLEDLYRYRAAFRAILCAGGGVGMDRKEHLPHQSGARLVVLSWGSCSSLFRCSPICRRPIGVGPAGAASTRAPHRPSSRAKTEDGCSTLVVHFLSHDRETREYPR